MGGFSSGPAAAAPPLPAEEEEAAPAAQEKTLFTLTLKSFEATAKPKIIKEIKSMLGLSLVESKKFVEGAPKMMKEGVPKEEGQKIVETMKALGGVNPSTSMARARATPVIVLRMQAMGYITTGDLRCSINGDVLKIKILR
ncbi:MAG: hypothetical protein Q9172_002124 [Xanthocarpia lactea]